MENKRTYRVVISERAARQMVEHGEFLARVKGPAADQLVETFYTAAMSLTEFPERNPAMPSDVFGVETYRKMLVAKGYLLIYRIKDDAVYVEYVLDCRQDREWLSQPR